MMTELDQLIQQAFQSEGATADVNKVYLQLLKTEFYVPAELHDKTEDDSEPYTPLFLMEGDQVFMIAFDSEEKLKHWAGEEYGSFAYVKLKGKEMIAAMGEKLSLALNPGTQFYKEFIPDEISKLKTIVKKIIELSAGRDK